MRLGLLPGAITPLPFQVADFIFVSMTRARNFPHFDSSELDLNSCFNVVIAYEDFETGKQAKRTYDFLVENLGQDCQFSNQMWKFEVLGVPKLREMAAHDVAMADIVIVSSHGSGLPPEVKDWIESWLAEPNHPIALVALFDAAEGQSTREVRAYLAEVAKCGQMEFFAQPDHGEESHTGPSDFAFRHTPSPGARTLSTIAGAVQRDLSFPHWGINE
jgi:hypothetical protein